MIVPIFTYKFGYFFYKNRGMLFPGILHWTDLLKKPKGAGGRRGRLLSPEGISTGKMHRRRIVKADDQENVLHPLPLLCDQAQPPALPPGITSALQGHIFPWQRAFPGGHPPNLIIQSIGIVTDASYLTLFRLVILP